MRTKPVFEEAKAANDPHGEKLRELLDGIKKQKVEEQEALVKKKKLAEVRPELIVPRCPAETLQQIYQRKLSQKAYQNKGYIVDGYPKTYADACNVFLGRRRPSNVLEIPPKDPEAEEQEIDYDKCKTQPTMPQKVILFEGTRQTKSC